MIEHRWTAYSAAGRRDQPGNDFLLLSHDGVQKSDDLGHSVRRERGGLEECEEGEMASTAEICFVIEEKTAYNPEKSLHRTVPPRPPRPPTDIASELVQYDATKPASAQDISAAFEETG